jgi:exonuclease VII small subunit
MVKVYEEGTGLIKFCLEKLDDAENKIKVLTGQNKNDFKLEKFDDEG